MKFLLVSTAVGMGGAERYLIELADWLVSKKHSVSFVVAEEVADAFRAALGDAAVEIVAADIGWAYGPEDNSPGEDYLAKVARQNAAMAEVLAGAGASADKVLLNANWPTHYPGTMEACVAAGMPFGVHFHLCPHRIYLHAASRRIHDACLPEAEFLSCVSDNNRFFLERTFGARFDFNVFPNGSRFVVPAKERKALAVAPRKAELVLVGRLDHQKGIVGLLPLLSHENPFGDLQLHILGEGPLRPVIEAQIGGRAPYVQLFGQVSDVRKRMERAEGLLLPSHFEGMSLSILEAMSLGCIPVVSDASSAREIITDGQTGFLFKVGDWRDMRAAIQRFVHCDRQQIRRNCLERSAEFTRDRMFRSMTTALTNRTTVLNGT